jgi:hypothetical protein
MKVSRIITPNPDTHKIVDSLTNSIILRHFSAENVAAREIQFFTFLYREN